MTVLRRLDDVAPSCLNYTVPRIPVLAYFSQDWLQKISLKTLEDGEMQWWHCNRHPPSPVIQTQA